MKRSKIIFYTGKMGVGKSTHSKQLSLTSKAIYLSEDDMLSTLYPEEIHSIKDYVNYSSRIKIFVKELVYKLTSNGLDVVLDFPGNTVEQRAWLKELITFCNSNHKLIYLKANDEYCLQHIMKRSVEEPKRYKFDSKEMYQKITKYFEEPSIEEGFNIEIIECK